MSLRAAVAAVVACVVAAGCGGGGTAHAPAAPSRSGPAAAPRTTSYRVAGPVGIAAAGSSVWIVSATSGEVVQRDADSGALIRRVAVGAVPLRAAYDRGLVWVSVFGAGQVVAIDADTGRIVRRIDVPGQPEGIIAAFDRIWVVRQAARRLTEISRQGIVGRSFPLGREPRLVAHDGRNLFVTNFAAGSLTRVNPRTGRQRTLQHLCRGPQGMAALGATLWVTCTPADRVVTVDTTSLRRLGTVAVPGEPDAVRAADDQVYVVSTTGPTVRELADPEQPTVTRSAELGDAAPLLDEANVDLAFVATTVWVTSYRDNKVTVMPRWSTTP